METLTNIGKLLLLVFFSFCITRLEAQQIIPRPIPMQEALPSNEVWSINQDKEGYIWLSTNDGLARYDGNEFTIIRNDSRNPDFLPSNDIIETIDIGQSLWISTHNGVRILDKNTFKFSTPLSEIVSTSYFLSIVVHSNNVWGYTEDGKLFQMSYDGDVVKMYDIKSTFGVTTLNALFVDRNGRLWLLSGQGGLWYFDQNKGILCKKEDAPDQNYFSITQDHQGRYWLGVWGEGLYRYDPKLKDQQFTHFSVLNSETGVGDGNFYSIIEDDDLHYLWLMSYNKLYCIDKSDDKVLRQVYLDESFCPNEMYTRFFKDREGSLWLSSYGTSMLVHFDNARIDSYELPYIKDVWGWNTNIVDLCVSKDFVWLAQDRLGLCTYDFVTQKLECVSTLWNHKLCRSHKENCVWSVENSIPLCRLFERKNEKTTIIRTIDFRQEGHNNNVHQIIEDIELNLWALVDNTIKVCNVNNCTFEKILDASRSYNLVCDETGNVWLSDSSGNIGRVNLQEDSIVVDIVSDNLVGIDDFNLVFSTIDKDGCLWGVSALGMVYHTDSKKTHIEHIEEIDSLLIGSSPMGVVSVDDCVYFLTRKQITRVNRYNYSSKTFYANDANINMSAFSKAIDFDGKESIFIGGQGKIIGLNISTQQLRRWDYRPLVTAIKVNDKPVASSSFLSDHLLKLDAGEMNIEISFSNLYYNIQQSPKIAYKLDGIDKSWRELPSGSHSAFFNRLPKGTYKLHLKHEYIPGYWAEDEEVLTICQAPYWYETWWAYTIYIIGILFLAYLLLSTPFERRKIEDMMRELKNKKVRRDIALGASDEQTEFSESDSLFIEQITKAVEANMKNPDFSVDELANLLCISRATLHRRMNQIASMTPLAFIKSKRISQACELLAANQMSISEITYEVGFSSPKYFTKCFKEYMNMSPSEFQKSQKTIE